MTSRRAVLPIPNPPDGSGIVSWVHFGDLHMTKRGENNFRDFRLMVEEVNRAMAGSLSFAYLPGDNADHGQKEEYELVRERLDRLHLPWFAIVGDHDVHSRSHANFLQHMMPMAFYAFDCGSCRFFALDSFAEDDPRVFDVSDGQLAWLAQELPAARAQGIHSIVLLHCYPSELGKSAEPLRMLLHRNDVFLVDMGHTHYNEIAHDGRTLYTATRSTGQVEEGPVGFSVTNVDNGIVSWRFKPLGEWPLVMITAPTDERLRTHHGALASAEKDRIAVRVKAWSDQELSGGFATMGGQTAPLSRMAGAELWVGELGTGHLPTGTHALMVELTDESGKVGRDRVQVPVRSEAPCSVLRMGRDKGNVLGAWPERGILGTQLGPNKNGRKW